MNRNSLFGRFGNSANANRTTKLLDYLKVHIEPLEDRKLLATQVVYVNDNWVMNNPGTLDLFESVKDATSGITRTYGTDAFGTVSGYTFDNTAGAYVTISAAINPSSLNSTGGTLSILDGTYTESDIVVDMNVVVRGFASSGASQTLITPGIASTPSFDGNGLVNPLGTNSHSGFLIYSPTVTIQALHIDGSGNGGLGTLQYQHGITTIYQANDGSNTGNYSAVSFTGATPTNLKPIQLNAASPSASPGTTPNTHVNISIDSNVVENVYYHGISLSARQNENLENTVASNPVTAGPRISNNTVNNVGLLADRNWERVGIFAQNVFEIYSVNNRVSNVGTGWALRVWNDSTHGAWGDRTSGGATGFGAPTTGAESGFSPFTMNTVTDAKTRGYEINFVSAGGTAAANNVYNTSNANLATNTTVGLYLTYSAMLLRGWRINGAFVGVEIQNTSRVNLSNTASARYPTLTTDFVINGPLVANAPRVGSFGILAQSGPSFSNPAVSEAGETPFEATAGDSISGYDTAIKINQANGFINTRASSVVLDRLIATGTNFGLEVGNHVNVTGQWTMSEDVKVTGLNSTFNPGYGPPGYINSRSPSVTPTFPPSTATTSAPAASSTADTQGMPGTIAGSNLTLNSGSTISISFSGNPASTLLDDFSANVPYSSTPQAGINPWSTNGFIPAGIRGPSWQTAGVITQNGTSGVFKIRPNAPSTAGATEVLNGYAYHYNMGATNGVWTTVDAGGFETMEVSLRLPNNLAISGNGSLTDGFSTASLINSDTGMRIVRIGLLDIDGNGRGWAIPTRLLSSTAFTTVRVNLAGPNVVANGLTPINSGSFQGGDVDFNLGELAGFYVIRENVNGDLNTNFGIVIDRISMLRQTGVDQFTATGNVTLGSATLTGTGNTDFTPSVGQVYTIINNLGANPINGKFVDGLGNVINEGDEVVFGDKYSVSYVGGTGNDVTLTVLNDILPIVDADNSTAGLNATATYTGVMTQVPAFILPNASLSDADDTLLNSVQVDLNLNIGTVENPNNVTGDHLIVTAPSTIEVDNPGDAEDSFKVNGTNIVVLYSRTTGILNMTGQDSLANYQSALQSVKYYNNGPYGPMAGTRTAQIRINNARSATANLTINVDPSNAIPIVDLNGGGAGVDNTVTYTNGQVVVSAKILVSPSATITDSDPSLFGVNVDLNLDADPDGFFTVTGDELEIRTGGGATYTLTMFDDHEVDEGDVDLDNENSNNDEYRITGPGIGISQTILSNYNSTNGQLTLQGVASVATYQSLLREVQYSYNYDYHDPTIISPANSLDHSGISGLGGQQRFMVVTAFDGVSQGGEANVTINGDLSNQEPFIDMDVNTIGLKYYQQIQISGVTPPYAVMNIGDMATLTDADDANLMAIRISTGSSSATEAMTAPATGGTNITAKYALTGGIGVMTLYGYDTVANYQQVLNSLTWQETVAANPTFNARSFTVRVFDGSSQPTTQAFVLFDQLYDPTPTQELRNPDPYIDLNGTFASNGGVNGNGNLVTYTGGAIALSTPNAVIDNPQYEPDIYTLTAQIMTIANNVSSISAGDVLDVPNAAFAGTAITKTYNAVTGTLTLRGWATTEAYNAALLQLTYDNTVDGVLPSQKVVRFIVSDTIQASDGTNPAGTTTAAVPATATIALQVGSSSVVNKQLFYNQSSFDGNNINVNTTGALNDDTAIATDKTAYAPGSGSMSMSGSVFTGPFANNPASFRHVSSFTRGINGLMIDITGSHPGITASDFIFKTGNNNSPSTWATAAAPTSVTVRTTGVGLTPGNTRVEIIWPNNSIRNTWLEVNVKANANTGLSDGAQLPGADGIGHIFFFGNRVGDSGSGDTAAFLTTATDEIGARNNPGSAQPITNRFDYNKDGLVTATDQITSRNNAGSIAFLNVLDPPNAPPAPAALTSDGNGVASALNLGSGGGGGTTSGWVANRLASVDLNSGPVARLFEHLAEKNTPGARKILVAADNIADDLDLDHGLLDSILADLGL